MRTSPRCCKTKEKEADRLKNTQEYNLVEAYRSLALESSKTKLDSHNLGQKEMCVYGLGRK